MGILNKCGFSPQTPHITDSKLSFSCSCTTTITESLPWASERLPRSNQTGWKSCELKRKMMEFLTQHSYMEVFSAMQDEEPALLEPWFAEKKLLDAHHISISYFTGEISSRLISLGSPYPSPSSFPCCLIFGLLHTFLRLLYIRNLMTLSV